MPGIVKVLVDVLHRIADVDVALVDANDIDQLAEYRQDRSDRGFSDKGVRRSRVGVGRQIAGVEISGPCAGGVDLDEDLFARRVIDRPLPNAGIVVLEDRSPCRAVIALSCQSAKGGGNHAVYDSLLVVLGKIPSVTRGIRHAILINRGGIVDPHHSSRKGPFGHSHGLVGRQRRRELARIGRGIRRTGSEDDERSGQQEQAMEPGSVKEDAHGSRGVG